MVVLVEVVGLARSSPGRMADEGRLLRTHFKYLICACVQVQRQAMIGSSTPGTLKRPLFKAKGLCGAAAYNSIKEVWNFLLRMG